MLQLKDILKSYITGDFKQTALNNVNLNFRSSEFVAILGQSGSGKTTLLNVIGGLDQYDNGDLIINGKSTKNFMDRDWDAYRNNSVGFIFQSYNLITHLRIIDNIEMGMTLSGVSSSVKHIKAMEVLERVGLKEHMHKKPNQLSGGQMQRVAIARALTNNPDIILADEPTGALDTETSKQIMELIKEISQDKLVIMVTHNSELAQRYANRIVRLSDGKVVSDTNPFTSQEFYSDYKLKKTSMNFFTALKLSGRNILTKKWRTALTSFASSIGIIGIALILSLSNGFHKQINNFESGTLSNFPITIKQSSMNVNLSKFGLENKTVKDKFKDVKKVYPYDSIKNTIVHSNVLTESYIAYLNKTDKNLLDGISYTYGVHMNILKKDGDKVSPVNIKAINFEAFPNKPDNMDSNYLKQYYDLLSGQYPIDKTDLVLIVDEYNRLDTSILKELGVNFTDEEGIDFNNLIGKEFKLIMNNDYYKKTGHIYSVNGASAELINLYNSSKAVKLSIVGIIRIKKSVSIASLQPGIAYSDTLSKFFLSNAVNSDVAKAQRKADYYVLTGAPFTETEDIFARGMSTDLTKDFALASLGATTIPTSVALYPKNFDAKERITAYLDKWNQGLKDEDRIEYTDMAAMVVSLSGNIMDGITIVLVAFAAISLLVSLIMIGIIIYISVLERTKEIGILRALGARKKDISRVFNAETFIIGSCSGLLGIGIAYLLTIPVNKILYNLTELDNVAQLNPLHAFTLVVISVLLTMLGGFIPSKIAAKKDPVEALRSD